MPLVARALPHGPARACTLRRLSGEMPSPMVRGFVERGQTCLGRASSSLERIARDTLLFGSQGLTNVRQKARMGRANRDKVIARLVQAELPVHRQPNL